MEIIKDEGVEQALRDTLLLSSRPCPDSLGETRTRTTGKDLAEYLEATFPDLYDKFKDELEASLSYRATARFDPNLCALCEFYLNKRRRDGLFNGPMLLYLPCGEDEKQPRDLDRGAIRKDFDLAAEKLHGRVAGFDDSAHDRTWHFSEDMPWKGPCSIARDVILGLIVTSHLTGHTEVLGWIWTSSTTSCETRTTCSGGSRQRRM
ncbi:hypothetical protein J8273_1710 [Carpediemonas membranifera]|uniref:Uncharacterized protein n=1 Tax=Carpediemonas membranifera TaxID=201153 RepID=A0A8J6BBA2_9EUKA|nr:hypothetical protein J8273_1710 [Carpediemonas membranifera]|eukprot:KAG9396692.1 hypothetical protein J8273_1710 [Carpediemonas membranifera]